jgi:hypothetical protein
MNGDGQLLTCLCRDAGPSPALRESEQLIEAAAQPAGAGAVDAGGLCRGEDLQERLVCGRLIGTSDSGGGHAVVDSAPQREVTGWLLASPV